MAEPILDQACLRLCAQLNQTLLTEHTKKMGSLTQCPITLYVSTLPLQNTPRKWVVLLNVPQHCMSPHSPHRTHQENE